ncbi:UNVERIFIED_CONTAM: hypothetical protein K2H54_074330 [Gekko kuhli]
MLINMLSDGCSEGEIGIEGTRRLTVETCEVIQWKFCWFSIAEDIDTVVDGKRDKHGLTTTLEGMRSQFPTMLAEGLTSVDGLALLSWIMMGARK